MRGKVKSEAEVERVWESYWRDTAEDVLDWDVISRTVYLALKGAVGKIETRTFLEVGCGTGRISAAVQRSGGRVALLDISAGALELAQHTFRQAGLADKQAVFVRGSVFALPFPDEDFDVVWNAGVLEHFTDEEQRQAIAEMVRVTKRDGKVVIIVPYRYSPLYRVGKFVMERTNRWPYGVERPIGSYRQVAEELNLSLYEHCTSFLPLIEQVLANLPLVGKSLQARFSARCLWMDDDAFRRVDDRWSAIGRGHLLCCTFRRKRP